MRINHEDLDKQKVATFISKSLKFSLIGEPWIANNGRHFATVGFKTWTSDYLSGKKIPSTGENQESEQLHSLDCIISDIIIIIFTFFSYLFSGFPGELPFHKIKIGAIQIHLSKPAIS